MFAFLQYLLVCEKLVCIVTETSACGVSSLTEVF